MVASSSAGSDAEEHHGGSEGNSGQGEQGQATASGDTHSGDHKGHLVAQNKTMEVDRVNSSNVCNDGVSVLDSSSPSKTAQLPASSLAETPAGFDHALVHEEVVGNTITVPSAQHRAEEDREVSGKVTGNVTSGPSKTAGNDNTRGNQRNKSISWAQDVDLVAGSSELITDGESISGAAEASRNPKIRGSHEGYRRTSVPWADDIADGKKPTTEEVTAPEISSGTPNPVDGPATRATAGDTTGCRENIDGETGPPVVEEETPACSSGTSQTESVHLESGEVRRRTSVPWAEDIAGGQTPTTSDMLPKTTSAQLDTREGVEAATIPAERRQEPGEAQRRTSVPWVEDIAGINAGFEQPTSGPLPVQGDDEAIHRSEDAEEGRPGNGGEPRRRTSVPWVEDIAGDQAPIARRTSPESTSGTLNADVDGHAASIAEQRRESGEVHRRTSVPWADDIAGIDASGNPTSGALHTNKENDEPLRPTEDAEGRRGSGNEEHRRTSIPWAEAIAGEQAPTARMSSESTSATPHAGVDSPAVATPPTEIHRARGEVDHHRTSVPWVENIAGIDHPTSGTLHDNKHDDKTTFLSEAGEERRGSGNDEHRRTSVPWVDDIAGTPSPKTTRDASRESHSGADGMATTNASETGTELRRQSSQASISWAEDIASGKPASSAKPTSSISAG